MLSTVAQSASALNFLLPWVATLPMPDGALTAGDSRHVVNAYSGEAVVVAEELTEAAASSDQLTARAGFVVVPDVTFRSAAIGEFPASSGGQLTVQVDLTDVVAGDFLLAQFRARNAPNVAAIQAAGWIQLGPTLDAATPAAVHSLWGRLAPTSGAQSYTFTQVSDTSNGILVCGISVWSGADESNIVVAGLDNTAQPTAPDKTQVSAPDATPLVPGSRALRLWAVNRASSFQPPGPFALEIEPPGSLTTRYKHITAVNAGHHAATLADSFVADVTPVGTSLATIENSDDDTAQQSDRRNAFTVILAPVGERVVSSDQITARAGFAGDLAEGAQSTDMIAARTRFGAELTEGATAAESLVARAGFQAALPEVAAASDQVASQGALAEAIAEPLESGDALVATALDDIRLTEAVASGDAVTSQGALGDELPEAAESGDAVISRATFVATLVETLESGDALSTTAVDDAELTEGVASGDSILSQAALGDELVEAAAAADAIASRASLGDGLTEGVEAGAAATSRATFVQVMTEAIESGDVVAPTDLIELPMSIELLPTAQPITIQLVETAE